MASPVAVYLEMGKKRVFACALEWPGWCRSGKTEDAALEALRAYSSRFAPIASRADEKFDEGAEVNVVERVEGSSGTEFGVPSSVTDFDCRRHPEKELQRNARLVEACWGFFDEVVAGAPQELRKGPRGGGRDRDAIAAHVRDAEVAYARKLGVKLSESDRKALLEAVSGRSEETAAWPATYGARRIAWHLLDHAWEIQDRSV